MDKQLADAFLRELKRQCDFVLLASQDLAASLKPRDADRVWYSLQALLVAGGNVSKILWPSATSGPKGQVRGDSLRDALGVQEGSPLRCRKLRNHLEHFDERLDDLLDGPCLVVDSNIGPANAIRAQGLSLRHYDPRLGVISFAGDSYELAPLLEAVGALRSRVDEQLRRLDRPPEE